MIAADWLPIGFFAVAVVLQLAAMWARRCEERRAAEWVQSFHGDQLPSPKTLRGQSATFLLAVMPHYLKRARR